MTTITQEKQSGQGMAILAFTAYAFMCLTGLGTAVAILAGVAWGAAAMGGSLLAAMGIGRVAQRLKLDPLNFVLGTMGLVLLLALAAAGATTL